MSEKMSFSGALEILGIKDYEKRIFNSNSRGELVHIPQYFTLANTLKEDTPNKSILLKATFRAWFEEVVEYAEKYWERPESVFQHIDRIFAENI